MSRTAEAQDAQSDGADAPPGYSEAISEAVGHYSAGRWRRAQEAFARAHALQPSARTYRGLGLANFYLENFAAARESFEQALADVRRPLAEEQRRELTELLRACARETGRFELRVAPPSARVELDGAATERRLLFLDRGEHVIAVSSEGHASERLVLTVQGGEDRALDVTLKADTALTAAVAAPDPNEASPAPVDDYAESEPSKGGDRVYTWVAAAAVPAFAGLAAAIWLTGEAEHEDVEDQCAIDRCDKAEADKRFDAADLDAYATWTSVSLAASGVALATAVVLFVIEGDEAPGTARLEVSPAPSGAAISGRF